MKLANDLDKLGRFEEADAVDEIIQAMAAEEADIDEAPMDLTEEEPEAVIPPALPAVPEVPAISDERANMLAELERLKKENETIKLQKLRKQPSGGIKISPKGGISVYGLGKWPVTLYRDQWVRLLDMKEKILQYITENEKLLKAKPQ